MSDVEHRFGVGEAEYIVDQVTLGGVMLAFEVPVDAFAAARDQFFDGPGKGMSVGHGRSYLRSWGLGVPRTVVRSRSSERF